MKSIGTTQDVKKIIVKPVPKISVQNRHQIVYNRFNSQKKQIDASIVTNKTKAKNSAETYFFSKDSSKTRMKAGLEEMVVNPFKGFSPLKIKQEYSLTNEWDSILIEVVKNDYVSLQTKFEILDGVEPDYYTQKITKKRLPGSILPEADAKLTFLETFNFTFYDRANIITNETTRGRFALQLVENHSSFAQNKENINPNINRFYIAEVNEDEIDYLDKEDVINECIAKLVTIQKTMTPSLLIDFATLLTDITGKSIITDDMNELTVKKKLNEYIKNKDKNWSSNIENFTYVSKMYEKEPQRFNVEVAVKKGLNRNIVKLQNGYLFWLSKRDTENYKFTSKDTLVQLLLKEYQTFKPKGDNSGNLYAEFIKEIVS